MIPASPGIPTTVNPYLLTLSGSDTMHPLPPLIKAVPRPGPDDSNHRDPLRLPASPW